MANPPQEQKVQAELQNATDEKRKTLYNALHGENESDLENLLEDNSVVKFINPSSSNKGGQDVDNNMHTQKTKQNVDWHLPLTLAALKYNRTMIDCILKKGANIRNQSENKRGDTVLHSLVRRAEKHPGEIIKIRDTFSYLLDKQDNNKSPQDDSKSPQNKSRVPLWLEKNGENLTVLSLATAKGVVEIVNLIIKEQNDIFNNEDKEFEYHDITHIDSVTNRISQKKTQGKNESESSKLLLWLRNRWKSKTFSPSVFEMLAYNEMGNEKAHAILQIKTINTLLTERWKNARCFIWGWMVIHFLYMVLITVYSSLYADAMKRNTQISIGFKIATMILAAPYLVISLLSLSQLVGPCRRIYWRFNVVYIFMIFIFGIFTMLHLVSESVTLYFLIVSLITGWLFMTFFLSTIKYFSFFTVMLKRVFLLNLTSYSFVMTIHLISFTTVMYMMLKTGNDDHEFIDVLFMMFKLMVGLSEFEDAENTESPVVSYMIYVSFVLLTYLVLMNALIAMMSEIFVSLNSEFQLHQWRLELSALLFLEETLLLCFLEMIWERTGKGSKFILKYKKYPVDEKQESLVPKHQKVEKTPLTLSSKGENNASNDISAIIEFPKYVLTNKNGHPLATIAQDSKPLLNHNDLNVIDVETHSPGLIILGDVETKRTLIIHLEEQELTNIDQKTPVRSKLPKNKVLPQRDRTERDKFTNDQTEDNTVSRSHSFTEKSSSYFDLPKYVLTDKSGQPFASIYVHKHEAQFPTASDIFNGANVIDVETHSPGLIIIDDPEKGRKLNIQIGEQYLYDESIAQQKKKRKDEEKMLTNTNDKSEGRLHETKSSNDGEKSETQKQSKIHEGANDTPILDENNGGSAQNCFYLTNKSKCHVATVLIHGPQEVKHDLSMFNVIDVETNSSAVLIFDDKEHSRRFNIHVEEKHFQKDKETGNKNIDMEGGAGEGQS